jgi:FixJ family two-component response regulator
MTTAPAATVFVVDDDASIRTSLLRLIGSFGWQVRAFESADAFLRDAASDARGCLVLDLQMPGLNGLELQQAIVQRGWVLPIVFITGRGDIPATVRAMKAGAVDFLTKPIAATDLAAAITRALDRARVESADAAEISALRARYETLTPREREVMALVVSGRLNKQVAGDLGTAEKTVKTQRGRVMAKMGANAVTDLVRFADRLGIRPPRV